MNKEKTTNRKDWIFPIGISLFAVGFWGQAILVTFDVPNMLILITAIVSIAGLLAAVLMVEPHKAKLKKYYPLIFLGVILVEIILQVIARLIF